MKPNRTPFRRRRNFLALGAVGVLCVAAPARATVTTLNFNSLPSAQGWTYFQSGLNESSVFAANGTSLLQTTVGTGFGIGNPNYYLPNVVNGTDEFELTITARILAVEGAGSGFAFDVRTAIPNQEYEFGFTDSTIRDPLGNTAVLDTTVFHTYVLNATPGSDYTLRVDGVLALTGPFSATGGAINGVQFGDQNDISGNANAEVSYLSFAQPLVPKNVPESGSVLLPLLASFLGIATVRSLQEGQRLSTLG